MRRFGVASAMITAVVGALLVFVPSSASAASDWMCKGIVVKRCAYVMWDRTDDTYQARARVTDVAGGGDSDVLVIDVKLQRSNGTGGWVTLRTKADRDGWHGTEDVANTSSVDPCNYPRQSYRVVATYHWRGAANGSETWSPDMSWTHQC